jgi:hypothetical protein
LIRTLQKCSRPFPPSQESRLPPGNVYNRTLKLPALARPEASVSLDSFGLAELLSEHRRLRAGKHVDKECFIRNWLLRIRRPRGNKVCVVRVEQTEKAEIGTRRASNIADGVMGLSSSVPEPLPEPQMLTLPMRS